VELSAAAAKFGRSSDDVRVGNKRKPHLTDRRSARHIKVHDAARVVGGLEQFIRAHRSLPSFRRGDATDVAEHIFTLWSQSAVMLRVDAEFANALLGSDMNVELTADWMDRAPFDALGFSFDAPFSLHDGMRLCHYWGFIAAGISSSSPYGHPDEGTDGETISNDFTRYKPLPKADGVRCLWLWTEDGSPDMQIQTVSLFMRGQHAKGKTLAELITAQAALASKSNISEGQELPVLVPLSLSLLLYAAATDPEIDWPPAEQIARPTPIRDTRIGNLGWRTGAALRRWRAETASFGPRTAVATSSPGGWRLPPHIRKAHWHRVRVAERNLETGEVTGDRLGIEGADWHYEPRWYPPTPVNVTDDGPSPAVREL